MNMPSKGVIISSFQCNAECRECCFECGPHITERLSLKDIKAFIDEVAKFGSVQIIVWSGGECFLLGEDLKRGIKYAKEKGMASRCVTNAYWATTLKKAKDVLSELKDLGLKELNISTGDDHQEFIPFDNVLNAIIAAAQLQLTVAVAIETRKDAKFKYKDLKDNKRYKKEVVESGLEKYVLIANTVWVSFHSDRKFEYDEREESLGKACSTLFDSVCITPDKTIVGCCGLCVEHIPELAAGKFGKEDLYTMLNNQKQDFLKIWLFVEGPIKILEQVKQWDSNIQIPRFYHVCQACAYMYQNSSIKKCILENYQKRYNEILERFNAKMELANTY